MTHQTTAAKSSPRSLEEKPCTLGLTHHSQTYIQASLKVRNAPKQTKCLC